MQPNRQIYIFQNVLKKDKAVELAQSEHQRRKRMKSSEDSFRNLWDNIKGHYRAPKENQKGAENLFD